MDASFGIVVAWLLVQIAAVLLVAASSQFYKFRRSSKVGLKIVLCLGGIVTVFGSVGFGYTGLYTFTKCLNTDYACNVSSKRKYITDSGLEIDFTEPKARPVQGDDASKTPKDQQIDSPSVNDDIQPNKSSDKPSPKTKVPNVINRGYYQQAYDWATLNKDCSYETCQYITNWTWPLNWGVESFYHKPPEVGAGALASHDGVNVLHIGNVNRVHGGSNECYKSKGGLILRLSGEENIDILGDGTPNKAKEQLNDKTPKHIVWKKLEGFYFIYVHPPAGLCPAGYADEQKAFVKLVQDMVRNLAPYRPSEGKCNCSTYSELIKYIDSKYPLT